MDLSPVATIMNTAEEFLGQHWIALAGIGHAAMIQVTQSLTHLTNIPEKICGELNISLLQI